MRTRQCRPYGGRRRSRNGNLAGCRQREEPDANASIGLGVQGAKRHQAVEQGIVAGSVVVPGAIEGIGKGMGSVGHRKSSSPVRVDVAASEVRRDVMARNWSIFTA